MNTATLIFAYSSTPGGWLIRHWPDSAPALWSHCGILLPAEPELGLPATVWHSTVTKGFRAEPADAFARRYKRHALRRFAVLQPAEFQRTWCEGDPDVSRGYALWTVVGRALGLRSSQRKGDHCAEVCENFLLAMGCTRRWEGDHHMTTPNVSWHNRAGVIE